MEIKELEPLRITGETGDTTEVYLSQRHTPAAYQRKIYELIHKSGMTEEEAIHYLETTPVSLELFYDIDRGLFAVEEEACECSEIYNPYTGKGIPNDNLPEKEEKAPRKRLDEILCELDKRQKSTEGKILHPAIATLLNNKPDSIKYYWSLPGKRTYYGNAPSSDESHLQKLLKLIVESGLIASSADSCFTNKVLQLFKDRLGDNDIWIRFNDRVQKQIEASRKSEETRRRNEKIRWNSEYLPFEEKLLLWKQGFLAINRITVPQDYGYNTILRIRKGKIETSKGITITSAEAARLWQMIHRFHENENEFKRDVVNDVDNHKWTVNSYQNDILTVGCHTIPYSEMREVAEQLRLAS